ncbi:regulatory protein ArsR [Methanococcus vannielii SB]|uniref:Regulatory protein ArsR n=1 Tax=Methanococcus vannielii (strain ATCC 35089 / DSM 1224 / JCM 13029 / OCM 148 / SB) TaxID=406327 RepID=A6UR10_METVS|nr:winged helix-turn-helix domain-containing protein [Methanococcus vannielii]ABR54932.1 regulatory protein ArsR [Methanococcus vannielii SB]
MDKLFKKLVKNKVRISILDYLLKKSSGCPEEISSELKISKGMPSQFLKECVALNIVKRERIGHKVYYSISTEYYLKIHSIVSLEKKKINQDKKKDIIIPQKKDAQTLLMLEDKKVSYNFKKIDNGFGGSTYILNSDNGDSFEVFKNKEGIWWCVSCQKQDCSHVKYIRKNTIKV